MFVAVSLVVVGGCASDGGDAEAEEVPKILLGRDTETLLGRDTETLWGRDADLSGRDAGGAMPGVEQMQPDLVQSHRQDGTGAYTAGYEWLDDAAVGGVRTLEYYRGTPLVVNFFSAQCPPCVKEMPEFQHVFSSLGGEVAFLGLSQDPTPEKAFKLVQKTGVLYDIGWDPDLEVYQHTGSAAMPTTAFFTAEGEMVEVFAGVLDRQGLRIRIDEMVGSGDEKVGSEVS